MLSAFGIHVYSKSYLVVKFSWAVSYLDPDGLEFLAVKPVMDDFFPTLGINNLLTTLEAQVEVYDGVVINVYNNH